MQLTHHPILKESERMTNIDMKQSYTQRTREERVDIHLQNMREFHGMVVMSRQSLAEVKPNATTIPAIA